MFKQALCLIIILLTLTAVSVRLVSFAQSEPLILLTWQAKNFAPSGFQGKNLPIINTPIVVGLEMIEKNQIVNLKNYEIRWFLDGKFGNSGKGMTTFGFRGGKLGGTDEHFIQAEIIDYKGKNLEKTLTIPLVKPQITIPSHSQGYQVPVIRPKTNTFKALPFFFNVGKIEGLEINWEAGGIQTAGGVANQDILNLNIPETAPDGFILSLKVTAINKNQVLERTSQSINLTLIR